MTEENEHRDRLLARLDALKRAVEDNDLPEEVLKAVYEQLNSLDELFPKDVATHSILELKGLGAEYWRSIDVEEYLRQERESWERPKGWPYNHEV